MFQPVPKRSIRVVLCVGALFALLAQSVGADDKAASKKKTLPRARPVVVVNEPTVRLQDDAALGVHVLNGSDDAVPVSLAEPCSCDALVVNDEAQPVPVRLVATAERIQFRINVQAEVGEHWGSVGVALPPGKRLLIDHVSGDIRLPVGEKGFVALKLQPNYLSSGVAVHNFPLTPVGTNVSVGPHAESYVFTQATNLFTDGEIEFWLLRGPTPSEFAQVAGGWVAISGRLVDQP